MPFAVPVDHGVVNAGTNSEIGKLDSFVLIKQYVPRLDIAVYVSFAMQVLQAPQRLAQHEGDEPLVLEAFGEGGFHQVEARPSGHVGHDDPQVLALREGAVGAEQVGVVRQDHGLHLLRRIVHVGLGAQRHVHDLDGDDLAAEGQAAGAADDGGGAVADGLEQLVVGRADGELALPGPRRRRPSSPLLAPLLLGPHGAESPAATSIRRSIGTNEGTLDNQAERPARLIGLGIAGIWQDPPRSANHGSIVAWEEIIKARREGGS